MSENSDNNIVSMIEGEVMGRMTLVYVLCIAWGGAIAGITFEPVSVPGDISIDTVFVDGVEYHKLSVEGFALQMDGIQNEGLPSIPFTFQTLLLKPDMQVDSIKITSENWEVLPGKYYLFPVQSGLLGDSIFTLPDSIVYNSTEPFPYRPIEISRQGSAMGYSVVSLTGTPIRYIPADSSLMVLTRVTVVIKTKSSEYERTIPNRETEYSATMRERGILSIISNPEALVFYQRPETMSFDNRTSYLNITQSPSPEGDGVDMVIITTEVLEDHFEQVADYRTQQGIVTVIRTVEWIDQFYSGCDTPERIRNFIRDAHEEWGIQAILLGGDAEVVPVRECQGWNYSTSSIPFYQLPSDDYYADIDGEWSNSSTVWVASTTNSYLDLCLGRWPVDNNADIDLMFTKLKLYEWPSDFPADFARKILLIGSDTAYGDGVTGLIEQVLQLSESGAIPEFLDYPTELYYPHTLPGGDLSRNSALAEFNLGYNLIIHADHSGVHEIGTAGLGALNEAMSDYDFVTMTNYGEPSILWTLGCDPGWFDGADCFAEAGLLAAPNSGLVAVIANSRYGVFGQYKTHYAFCDALFSTGWIAEQQQLQSLHWPLSYIGEAHRCSKNNDDLTNINLRMNLFGSPLMYVWRDDPMELSLSVPPLFLREGIPQDITVTVTDGVDPVENATVCLWKKNEIFSVLETNVRGRVTFDDVCIADGDQDIIITVVKRRRLLNQVATTVVSYVPDRITIDVLPANIPIVTLESFLVDAVGDGTANPGETVDIYLTAKNSGGETASNVTAELSLVSGGEFIAGISDDEAAFPAISVDQAANSTDPLTISINSDVASYSTVEFNVTFTYEGISGNYQWESPLSLTVYSEGYQLTVVDPVADNSSGQFAVITLSDMFLANCGLEDGNNLEITIDNIIPSEPFTVNMLTNSGIESNAVAELNGQITLTVNPQIYPSPWLQPRFPGCSFDVVVSSDGGDFIARSVNVSLVDDLQSLQLGSPSDLQAYEVGQNYISLLWEHDGSQVAADGYYVYYNDGEQQYRAFPLPVPVQQVTIDNLLPGRDYTFQVTAVDEIGRESEPVEATVSTTCPAVTGWPVQLNGSPGGGPAIVDIDQDGADEIVVATSFGVVYLIERDGSYQTLTPPVGYDFDKFLGCAVGDIDGDSQLEIVVSSQRKIEVTNQEQVSILFFNKNGAIWNVNEITSTNFNEEVASPFVAGTPVLFQANNDDYLEIALRTKANYTNGGTPHLYVWRYDAGSGNWVNFSNNFPVSLDGYFYSAPTAVDFDEDGFEELIVTSYGSAGAGTELKIIDFQTGGHAVVSTHGLPELDTQNETARVFGTLAAAEENGAFYISGVAKTDVLSGSIEKVFVYALDSDPVDVTLVWQTPWMNGWDFCGNLSGPSIGDLDGNSDLEVVYTLNGENVMRSSGPTYEGVTYGWDLGDGSIEFQSTNILYNPVIGGGSHIRSQPVTGLTTTQGSGEMTIFSGFSSYLCGHDPQSGSSMLEGFPSWTRDASFAAPAVCDLDGDGLAEVLYIDYSGHATLFDWDGFYTTDGWHMYQDNPLRNGFYNTPTGRGDGLDISVSESFCAASSGSRSGNCVFVEIEITGAIPKVAPTIMSAPVAETARHSAPVSSMGFSSVNSRVPGPSGFSDLIIEPDVSLLAEPVIRCRTVEVVAFNGDRPISSVRVPLEEGFNQVEIPLQSQRNCERSITVIADPFNEYLETNETNNSSTATSVSVTSGISEVFIPSPAETIELSINLASTLSDGVEIRIYSIDGRLVGNVKTEELHTGNSTLFPCGGGDRLPAGMYTVCVSGFGEEEFVRKVIILGN